MNLTKTKFFFLKALVLAFFLIGVFDAFAIDSLSVKSPINCSQKAKLKIDFDGSKDVCLVGKRTTPSKCKKLSRKQIRNSVNQQVQGKLTPFYLENLVEYVSSRIHRMEKVSLEGRDFCHISLRGRSLKNMIGSN